MATSSSKLGTPVNTFTAPTPPAPPPTVIPTSCLAQQEQRWFLVSLVGLLEVTKVWDILAPYFISDLEPTWSSAVRVRGPWSATGWTLFEITAIVVVSFLRIPMLSPSNKQLAQLAALVVAWNIGCWLVADPGAFFMSVNLVGPVALGGEWYWSWWYTVKRWREPAHLEGVHRIRRLPYSTATLNPLSLSYCIPPDSHQLLYIPVVFNNSIPDQVSYYIRSLDTGHAEVKTVAGSSMKRSRSGRPRQQSANEDDHEEDVSEPDAHPLSAMVLRSQTGEVDVAKLPSVKPSDSLALVPQDLTSSQQALFLTIDRPSVVSLKSVVDKRGDRFHITPHKEAIIVECPTGGHWMYEDKKAGQLVRKADKQKPAEVRCVGDEEIAQFQARGVGALKAGWRKKSKDSSETGMIEGIEDEVESVDQLALFRRDRISKTHTVPLRVVHDRPGVHTVSLTSVTDSMHNSCTPSGHWAEKLYNVISRPSARLDCSGPREILVGKTMTLPVIMDEAGSSVEVSYSFTSAEGQVSRKSLKASKRTESITVSEPGTYTLRDIQGPCGGNIMEPSSCLVQLVPLPTVEMQVTTLHECAMDVGVTAAFDFTGSAPFVVEYTEKREGGRVSTKSKEFKGYHGDIVLQPDREGQYTYTFTSLSDSKYSRVKLDKPPIQQTVHPLANVDVATKGINPPPPRKLFACSGDEVDIEVEAKQWEVTYTLDGGPDKTVMLRDPNNHLTLDHKGVYRLSSVKDSHCPGIISEEEATFEVDFKPRPAVQLLETSSAVREGDAYRHKGLCAGEEDQVALRFNGQSPFELGYRYTADGHTSKHTLKSAQETGILHLAIDPGHHRYDFLDLKDSNYDSTSVNIVLEHDVYSRPSASFSKLDTDSICLDEPLRGDAKVQLRGKAPFVLTMTVRKPASIKVEEHHMKVDGYDWTLELPHVMGEVGRHEVTITSVADSSGCDQVVNEFDRLTTTVEVVESARIVPATQQADLCVGDTLDFLLQGKAPWTIEYEWLGKRHKVTSPASRFSRYAEEKGVFAVRSVALKDDQCKRDIVDLERRVHPLPSVKIQDGLDSLRESDEPAVFSVTFSGTPPFSFTYTRSEQIGSGSKVFETQTVTDIWTNSYSISSTSEGDYAVTAVADKYCRYPPLSRARKDT